MKMCTKTMSPYIRDSKLFGAEGHVPLSFTLIVVQKPGLQQFVSIIMFVPQNLSWAIVVHTGGCKWPTCCHLQTKAVDGL